MRTPRAWLPLAVSVVFALAVATSNACSDDVPSDQSGAVSASHASSVSASGASAGSTSSSGSGAGGAGGADAGGPPCSPDPMTYLEIINACTNAQQVSVHPVLPLLTPDGGLPPLP